MNLKTKPMPEKNNFLFFILIIFALEAILFSIGNEKLDTAFLNKENEFVKIQKALADIPVQAKAFSVYDETLNRKIYGKNDNAIMPIASLAKIMTIVTILNNGNTDDTILVSAKAIKEEGDCGLFVNEKFKIGDLAKFTLIGSANDGAYALSESKNNLLEKINNKARKIGMQNTLFLNFTGLDINENFSGAYASAQDVNVMTMYALKAYPEIFEASVLPEINVKSESGFDHNIKNTNDVLKKIPNLLFSKTGFTPLDGGNLTIIYQNEYKHNIAITVLGSTPEGRFSDMEKIIDTLYNLGYGS